MTGRSVDMDWGRMVTDDGMIKIRGVGSFYGATAPAALRTMHDLVLDNSEWK